MGKHARGEGSSGHRAADHGLIRGARVGPAVVDADAGGGGVRARRIAGQLTGAKPGFRERHGQVRPLSWARAETKCGLTASAAGAAITNPACIMGSAKMKGMPRRMLDPLWISWIA